MQDRVAVELGMLKGRYPDMEVNGRWVRIPAYPLPTGWNRDRTDVAFEVPPAFPGTPPYGIYTPSGLQYDDRTPKNYTEPAPTSPPFVGTWGVFSWSPDGEWRATADPRTGSNLLNWVLGFGQRFREGV